MTGLKKIEKTLNLGKGGFAFDLYLELINNCSSERDNSQERSRLTVYYVLLGFRYIVWYVVVL